MTKLNVTTPDGAFDCYVAMPERLPAPVDRKSVVSGKTVDYTRHRIIERNTSE